MSSVSCICRLQMSVSCMCRCPLYPVHVDVVCILYMQMSSVSCVYRCRLYMPGLSPCESSDPRGSELEVSVTRVLQQSLSIPITMRWTNQSINQLVRQTSLNLSDKGNVGCTLSFLCVQSLFKYIQRAIKPLGIYFSHNEHFYPLPVAF